MTDAVDISGMPPPPPELVSGDDPSAGMPTPAEVFRQNVGRAPENDVELDNFTHNPENWARSPQTPRTGKEILSRATGVGQVAAQAALAVPAAVAGAAGYARGALAAGLEYSAHPNDMATANANALKDLETGRERGRRWAGNVYDLSKYVPATKEGEEFAQQDVPAAIGSVAQTVGKEALEPVIGENATRAVGDVAQDLSIVAPALGVRGYAKGAVDLTKKAAARANPKAPEGTTYSAEGTAEAPSTVPYTAEVPPVRQVSADTILNKPDPIPPPEPRQTPQETRSTPSVDPGAPDPAPLSNNRERGSVRVMRDKGEEGPLSPLFYAPKEDGAQQQADPTQEPARLQSLKDLNALSGGTMEGYRPSAVTGDYRATAQDFHDANGRDPAGQQMAAQLASEHEAPAEATRRLHQQLGSGQLNSVDPEVLAQGGRTVRDAVHGVEDWHEGATNQIYDAARSGNAGRTLPRPARVDHILNDDGNFVTTNAQALQKAAKAQLDRLWTTGDPDQGIPPGSINGAEAFRQFLNEAHPDSQGVVKKLKNALDMHVAENGGPGLFEVARNQKIHESQQLGPKFMQKFLQPTRGDLDHPVDVRQWMDRAVNLPPEQFNHFMNVIESGAHLDKANLAPKSAAAIKALQAHVVSRIYEASRGEGGKWNARNFYDRASSYAPNLRRLFADNPEALERLQTINRGSNVLKMDSHYPGAAAQAALTGLGESGMHGAREKAGVAARGLVDLGAHSVLGPLGPTAAEISGVSGKAQRLIAGPTPAERVAADRAARVKGNIRPLERGSVGVMPEEDNWFGGKKIPGVDTQSKQPTEADFAHAENVTMETPHEHFIDDDGNHVFRTSDGNTELKAEPKGNTLQMRGALTKPGSERGGGSLLYQKIAEYATQNGGKLGSDFSVSKDAQRRWTELHRNGWDVKQHPEAVRTANGTLIAPRDEPVYMVNGRRPNAPGVEPASGTVPMGQRPAFAGQKGSARVMNEAPTEEGPATVNVGLHQGDPANGGRVMKPAEVTAALQSQGVKIGKTTVVPKSKNGPSEPTVVANLDRKLSPGEMQNVLAKTKQSAIPQHSGGEGEMHVAPGHEETAAAEGWDKFNPDYFREHNGKTMTENATSFNPDELEHPPHPNATVRDAVRSKFPGIYDKASDILGRLKVAPEDPILKQLFGVTRKDLHDVAVNRQGNLPGNLPGAAAKPKGSAAASKVMTSENADRLVSVINEAKKNPELYHGMAGWYVMDPLHQKAVQILGRAGGTKAYARLNNLMAMASPGSDVMTEINRGTAANMMAEQGKFGEFLKHAGKAEGDRGKNFPPELEGVSGHPYHSTAQGKPMQKYLQTGEMQMKSPKVPMYAQASGTPETGFQNATPVGDSHWARGVGLSDVRTSADPYGSVSNPEMSALKDWYRKNVSARVGIPATSAQAVQWGALGGETGVETAVGAPKLELFAQSVAKAAKRLRITPEEALERIIRGTAHGG